MMIGIDDDQVAKAHVVRVQWHAKLNQILAATSDGGVRMYFDAERSHRGAKICYAKPKKRVRQVLHSLTSFSSFTSYIVDLNQTFFDGTFNETPKPTCLVEPMKKNKEVEIEKRETKIRIE